MKTSLKIPKHIAIIMDGNARWAEKNNLPLFRGHQRGAEIINDIVAHSKNIGVKFLTLYAFSTENWSRPKEEVDSLMELLYTYLTGKFVAKLIKNNVKLNFLGDITRLPKKVQEEIKNVVEKTKKYGDFELNIAVNYGARDEIVRAVNKILTLGISRIEAEDFENYLDTKNIPDPELLIRTAGEFRVSNFLLWQIAYSEIFVSNIFWPDFNAIELDKAIESYNSRSRKFGGRV